MNESSLLLEVFLIIYLSFPCIPGFPGGDSGKEPSCQGRRCKRHGFDPRVGRIPWRRKWLPTPVVLPGKSHGQRSLAGYSPWGRKESDMTERLSTHTVGRGLDAKRSFQYHCALWPGTYSIYCPSPLSLLLEKSREARLA